MRVWILCFLGASMTLGAFYTALGVLLPDWILDVEAVVFLTLALINLGTLHKLEREKPTP